ncbi:MAG: hypothetical protein K0Q79_1139 [Flavipsychrobacter sp.]|jgi:hypothetical protein|nr:hypothetical protein [Flavipsychrobacter sp.]
MLLIKHLADAINKHVSGDNYGADIEHYFIGFICIKTPPGYEEWYKNRRPRYRELAKTKGLDGSVIETKRIYSYDIKIENAEYDKFISLSDELTLRVFSVENIGLFV